MQINSTSHGQNMLIVRTPVRISFAGGGTDLPSYFQKHGGAVISATINKYFYTVLSRRTDGRIQIISSDLRTCETWQNTARVDLKGTALEIPLAVLKELDADVSVDLFLASEIPPGTGLGSSAAVCVNVLKAITTYLKQDYSDRQLAEKAYYIARDVLKKPVGKQDEFAVSVGGINLFRFERDNHVEIQPLSISSEILEKLQSNLMLFFTGVSHDSWTILKDQEQSAVKSDRHHTVEALHEIRGLVDRTYTALTAGDLKSFGCLLHEGWEAKKRVSSKISNPRIDFLYQTAKTAGALGGKITGAGGGGFLLLYCEKDKQSQVRRALEACGIREMGFSFDFHGVQVIADNPFLDQDNRCSTSWALPPAQPGLNHILQ